MNPDSNRPILLVEDNPDDVELTLRTLAENGIANPVLVAKDGVEALDFLLPASGPGLHPSLVLLDLNLPRLNGLEVLEAMRADPRTALVPIVVLTTSNEERDVIDSYRDGCNCYVRKPVGLDEFKAAVRQLGLFWLVVNIPPPPGAERRLS